MLFSRCKSAQFRMSLVPQVLSGRHCWQKRQSCPLPAPTLSPPLRWHSHEVKRVGKYIPFKSIPAKNLNGWGERHLLLFRVSPAYPGLKSSWNHRVSAIHCSRWKSGASLVCPKSFWLKGNCAAAGNSIKWVSKHFHSYVVLGWFLIHLYYSR